MVRASRRERSVEEDERLELPGFPKYLEIGVSGPRVSPFGEQLGEKRSARGRKPRGNRVTSFLAIYRPARCFRLTGASAHASSLRNLSGNRSKYKQVPSTIIRSVDRSIKRGEKEEKRKEREKERERASKFLDGFTAPKESQSLVYVIAEVIAAFDPDKTLHAENITVRLVAAPARPSPILH